jgi:SAM-dependent methyltransferase
MAEPRNPEPKSDFSWDDAYRAGKQVWGDQPSEVAKFAVERLKPSNVNNLRLLDVGCGYGRDAKYLNVELGIAVTGVDSSASAIEIAKQNNLDSEFLCADFEKISGAFNVIYASNVYQVLKPSDRHRLVEFVKQGLPPGGILFLGTMSVSDPEHYGKGTPVPGDENSFIVEKYIHLSTKEELEREFAFLNIDELTELEFYELRSDGATHHHKTWLLMATKKT